MQFSATICNNSRLIFLSLRHKSHRFLSLPIPCESELCECGVSHAKREEHHCLNAVVGSVTWEQIVVKEMIVTGESAPVRVKRCRMDRKSVRAWAVSWGFASLKPKHFHAEAFCSFWPSMHFAVTMRCCAALWSATFRRCEGIFFGPTAVWHSVVITARS